MSERFYTVLSSAGSLADIEQAISDFYCGSVKTLRPKTEGYWHVYNANGTPLAGVHVRTKRGRYLFVSTP